MELTESRIANLENLKKAGTVVLGIKDSQKDIFSKEYRQALTAIHHIVQESKLEAKRYTSKQKNGWMDPWVDPCADPETYQNITLHRIHTVVSFIGSRGTGKTSAMLTVLRQLQTLRCSKELEASLQPLASISFICLEPIDAGILQSGEDIIAIVLARMFNYLQQITNGNNLRARYQEELRSLYREFDKLYQNICRLRKGGGHFLEGESALRGLQNLASSHSTAREFKDLVSHLLTYIKTLNGGEKDQYLVIALDDIDMYGEGTSQNCYTLLEEIFDYLSFPGIIVLTTYNENLLKRNCSNHLREKFIEGKKSNDCSVPEQKEVKTLVQQFLEKLILEEYRVYMPVLNRIDVSNRVGIGIRLDNTRDPELCVMFADLKEDNDLVVPVKQFLLWIIAARTNVYFDSRGKKRHFLCKLSNVFGFYKKSVFPVRALIGKFHGIRPFIRFCLPHYLMKSALMVRMQVVPVLIGCQFVSYPVNYKGCSGDPVSAPADNRPEKAAVLFIVFQPVVSQHHIRFAAVRVRKQQPHQNRSKIRDGGFHAVFIFHGVQMRLHSVLCYSKFFLCNHDIPAPQIKAPRVPPERAAM